MKNGEVRSSSRTQIHLGVAFILALAVFIAGIAPLNRSYGGDDKRKLYISAIKTDGVSQKLADEVRDGLKLEVIGKFGQSYYVIDDEAVRIMYAQAEKILSSGSSDESCTSQIAEAINADEIIYGEIRGSGGELTLVLNNLVRDRKALTISAKSMFKENFSQRWLDHFIREAAYKLVDPSYTIRKPGDDDLAGVVSLKGIEVDYSRGSDIAELDFNSPDESVQKILSSSRELLQEGDRLFKEGKYEKAAGHYCSILERIRSKLSAEKQAKMGEFVASARRRADTAYAMMYKPEIEEVDRTYADGGNPDQSFLEKMSARYGKVRAQVNKETPSDARGEAVAGILKTLDEREDSMLLAMAGLIERKGDEHYREYRFGEALECYETGGRKIEYLHNPEKKTETVHRLEQKVDTVSVTGRNYVQNSVKRFADLAEHYNFKNENSSAKKSLKEARKLLSGPLVRFASAEALATYNGIAKVLTAGEMKREDYPGVFDAIDATRGVKVVGGIEFVFVPGGTFSMGSPESEGGSSERPQHKVTVNGFWMAKYECTQAQYEAVMGDNASGFKAKDNPAESVSWDDAKKFCGKFKNKNDIAIRLPTEAEWEYACRAGTGTRYYWGDEMDGAYCWFVKNSEQKTHPVGSRQPNGFGLYDMSGNVSEWCADAYDERYYKNSPEKDPAGPGNGDRHVVRGGSWCLIADYMRSAFRDKYLNSYHNNYIGFRPVLEAPLPRKK